LPLINLKESLKLHYKKSSYLLAENHQPNHVIPSGNEESWEDKMIAQVSGKLKT
jgi:hypothetical protein